MHGFYFDVVILVCWAFCLFVSVFEKKMRDSQALLGFHMALADMKVPRGSLKHRKMARKIWMRLWERVEPILSLTALRFPLTLHQDSPILSLDFLPFSPRWF